MLVLGRGEGGERKKERKKRGGGGGGSADHAPSKLLQISRTLGRKMDIIIHSDLSGS